MDRFHTIQLIEGKASRRKHVVRGQIGPNGKQHQGLIIFGQKSGEVCQETQKTKEKQHWAASEKRELENARRLRGIYFFEPEDEELK